MAQCPVCQEHIELSDRHSGTLFTCPHCKGAYFIGWDGQPEGVVTHEPLAVPESPESLEAQPEIQEPEPEAYVAPAVAPEWTPEPAEEPAPPAEPEKEYSSPDFSDVADYANADRNAGGPLSYTLHIRGLELADTFEKLREALTDSRFGWDSEDIMRTVSAGELLLKGLNPTKASILVSRIKYLPVELDWTQEVFGEA